MEVLIHFIFQLFKIAILASFYSFILLSIFQLIGKSFPQSWFWRASRDKRKFWVLCASQIYFVLFIWMFTYWGSHGLGDSARIPIGNGYAIENINWNEYAFIRGTRTQQNKKVEMTKFLVVDNKLMGNLDGWFDRFENRYFVLDLKSKALTEFKTVTDFDKFASENNLPAASELKKFNQNYRNYWSGWRFLFLP